MAQVCQVVSSISIHALLAESDACIMIITICIALFLSTLSLRRATRSRPHWAWRGSISIHALLAESDCVGISGAFQSFYFYPRSPCGERPPLADGAEPHAAISIHALLAESDQAARRVFGAANIFLSTLSLRRATSPHRPAPASVRFLSTLSLRRATTGSLHTDHHGHISIHALLAESDHRSIRHAPDFAHFYPRSPCGERLMAGKPLQLFCLFLSTLSLRRATDSRCPHLRTVWHFYPRSPCGERHPLCGGVD